MTLLLFRFARRMSSWDGELSPEDIQKVEFRRGNGEPDLRPSVYQLRDDPPMFERAYAEHAAAAPIDPERSTIAIDSQDCDCPVANTPGLPAFAFIHDAHRELLVNDTLRLLALIRRLKGHVADGRKRVVTKPQVIAYAKSRVAAGDPEWLLVEPRRAQRV